jgi:hypothetical protein
MDKNDVVELMSDYIDNMNRQLAKQNGMDATQTEQMIAQGRPQLVHVNGLLYDLLVENDVISE